MATPNIFGTMYAPLVVETALAVYEELLRLDGIDKSSVNLWREDNGATALRHAAMFMAPRVDQVWIELRDCVTDRLTWDWEFVPAMVKLFAWSDCGGYGEFPSLADMHRVAMELSRETPEPKATFMIPNPPGVWDCD